MDAARRALRVLHVAPYSPQAWGYGGIPRVVGALARGLAERGHRVTICATDARDQRGRLRAADLAAAEATSGAGGGGVETRIFTNLSDLVARRLQLYLPLGMRGFLDARCGGFDVAHLHAHHNLPVVLAARACRRAGVPFVVTPNGTALRGERRRRLKTAFDTLFGEAALARASRVLAVTEVERALLERNGFDRERLAVVPNPIDLDEYDPPVERGRFRARERLFDAPLVLYLGRVSPRKRVDVLVRAFARLERQDGVLAIAGDDMGGMAQVRAAIAAEGVAGRVRWLGLLDGRERLEAMADADVVSYATEGEIFGLVAIEALAVGTPVVVGDDSGCAEIVAPTGGGIAVAPGDLPALAAALGAVFDDPAGWRERARAAAQRLAIRYGSPAVAARVEAVYEEVVAESRSGPKERRR